MEIEKLKNSRVEMENETQMEIEKLKRRQEKIILDFEKWKIEANSKHQKEMKQLGLDESRKAESHVESCR